MKILIARVFTLLGWLVLFEKLYSDVISIKCTNDGGLKLDGSEAETSLRNMIRNVNRNFANGCDSVLILVPTNDLLVAARRKVNKELSPQQRSRVGITTISQMEKTIKRLEGRK
jgi:hypothetical protein